MKLPKGATLEDLYALGVKCGRAGYLHPRHATGFVQPMNRMNCRSAVTLLGDDEQAKKHLGIAELTDADAAFLDGLIRGLRARADGRGLPW